MKKGLAFILCFALLLQMTATMAIIPVGAAMSDDFAEKYVIFDGGSSGKTVTWKAGNYVVWDTKGFDLEVPMSMPEEKIGLYLRITLDAAAAAALNTAGEIELAYEKCDKSEIHCSTTVAAWREGENEVVIPMMAIGGYTDGGQERFDIYETVNWFRFYTTPGTTNLPKDAKATIWEISVVDSTAAGMEFGGDDTYMTLTKPLAATPNTIEASVKANALTTSWTLGTYSGVRYDSAILSNKTGTIRGVDGIPDGTSYVGGTVKKGGFFGTKDLKFNISIPKAYSRDQLALTFWLYTSTGKVTKSYLELTSSGTCDKEELCWTTKDAEFANLQKGWNKIVLPLNSREGSGFDYTRINYTRMWGSQEAGDKATSEFEMYVSEMKIEVYSGGAGGEQVSDGDAGAKGEFSSDNTYMIFSNYGSDDAPIALYLNAQGNVAWMWGEQQYTSDFNTFTGEWIDLALVRDMSVGKFLLYADGEVVYEASAANTPDIVPKTPHSIAADGEGAGLYEGWLADIRVWADVRSAQEIRDNRVPKIGHETNGLSEKEPGLLGAWFLMGSTDRVLNVIEDMTENGNHAVFAGTRADHWVDYRVPTDVIGENYYTIVFIPDTQELVTGSFTEEWMAAAQWISDNVEKENIVHVIGAGDSTWTASEAQWEIARAGFDLFTGKVSWSNQTGNHDYLGSCLPVNDTTYTIRDSRNYQRYFGEEYINETAAAATFVDYFDDPYDISTTENSYYRFTVNGIKWMILQLEYQPRVHVIEWANEIAAKYPDDNIILTTHSYINTDKAEWCTQWMPYTKKDHEIGGYLCSLEGKSWPDGTTKPIWEKLVRKNGNIKLLLCGHAGTSDGHVLTKLARNDAGIIVPQLMINAQDLDVTYYKDAAMAMLGLLRFSADGKHVEVQYYSPYHGGTYHPSNRDMLTLTLDITGQATEQIQYPQPQTPDEPPIDDTPDAPIDAPDKPDKADDPSTVGGLVVILIAAAVIVVGAGVTVPLILMKKKKK